MIRLRTLGEALGPEHVPDVRVIRGRCATCKRDIAPGQDIASDEEWDLNRSPFEKPRRAGWFHVVCGAPKKFPRIPGTTFIDDSDAPA